MDIDIGYRMKKFFQFNIRSSTFEIRNFHLPLNVEDRTLNDE